MIGHFAETEKYGVLYIPRGSDRIDKYIFDKRECHIYYTTPYMAVKELEEPEVDFINAVDILSRWKRLE